MAFLFVSCINLMKMTVFVSLQRCDVLVCYYFSFLQWIRGFSHMLHVYYEWLAISLFPLHLVVFCLIDTPTQPSTNYFEIFFKFSTFPLKVFMCKLKMCIKNRQMETRLMCMDGAAPFLIITSALHFAVQLEDRSVSNSHIKPSWAVLQNLHM